MTCNGRRALSLAAIFFLTAFAAPAAKAEATDPAVQQVQTFYDTLLDSMKHAKELGVKGRYEKLKPVIEQTFDLPGMVRLAVGPRWTTIPAAEQQELLAAFERMTAASYAGNFNGYDGEKFVVEPATTVRGTDRVVQSKLIAKDQTVPFGYRMRQSGGSWKILDIYLNGYISQLGTQRSDLGNTLATGGAPALVKKLDALSDKLLNGN
ncbi:MAG TPA: ABC transporter substrate-binding protein [Rhizomicrobium sp.]